MRQSFSRFRSLSSLLRALLLPAVALPLAFAGAPPAFAQSDEKKSSLPVEVDAAPGTVDADAVRTAVGAELGVHVSSGPAEFARLIIRVDAKRVADLEFESPSGHSVRRRVELPKDHGRAVETIALLAGNLVRDEASELLAELQKSQSPEPAPDVPPATADTPPPTETKVKEQATPASTTPAEKSKPAAASAARKDEPEPEPTLAPTFFNAALFHPVSLHPDSQRRSFQLELALVYDRIGGLEGLGLTLFVSSLERSMQGVQLAGLASYTAGRAEGVSLAGLGTVSRGKLEGFEGAGLVNLRLGNAPVSGRLSFNQGAKVEGVQLTAGWNHTAGDVEGAQVGSANSATGLIQGFQLGFANYAQSVHGAELGVFNLAKQSHGAQIGFVNVSGRASGTQLGFVNVAEEMEGEPIGFLSIAGNTRFHAIAFASTRFPANAGVKLVTHHVVNELSLGADPSDPLDGSLAQAAWSIGAHISFGPLFLEPTVGYGYERHVDDRSSDGGTNAVLYRAKLGWQLFEGFALFAGGGLVQVIPEKTGRSELEGGEALAGVQLF
jgi:hypothetical protein